MELFLPTLFAFFVIFPLSIVWTFFGVIKVLPKVDRFVSTPERRLLRFVAKPTLFCLIVPAPIIFPIGFVNLCLAWLCGNPVNSQQIQAFWDWFPTVQERLYSAKSANDPAVIEFGDKLRSLNSGFKFRLGPLRPGARANTHRRELAISGAKNSCNELLAESSARNFANWMIGEDFQPPSEIYHNDKFTYEYDVNKVCTTKVSDFSFTLLRNGDTIDATIYTDKPFIENYNGCRTPIDEILETKLGSLRYQTILGAVTVRKRSEYKGNEKLKTVAFILDDFDTLLTNSEREDLADPISRSHPVVAQTMKRIGLEGMISAVSIAPNPYVSEMHRTGTGVNQAKIDKFDEYNWTVSQRELDNAKTAAECIELAEHCWRTCQLDATRILLERALSVTVNADEKRHAANFLKCRVPSCNLNTDARKHFNQAMVEISNASPTVAIEELTKCIELAPTFEWPHRHLSNIYRVCGELDAAETAARKSVELNPNYARGWAELAKVLFSKQDSGYDKAIRIAEGLDADDETVHQAKELSTQELLGLTYQQTIKKPNQLNERVLSLVRWAKQLPVIRDLVKNWG